VKMVECCLSTLSVIDRARHQIRNSADGMRHWPKVRSEPSNPFVNISTSKIAFPPQTFLSLQNNCFKFVRLHFCIYSPKVCKMSSRQLRKLQQQRELEQAQLQVQAEEEESEGEPVALTKPKPSLFANLAALEDENQDEDGDEDEEKDDAPEPVVAATPPSAAKKAKKSKKKKKGKKAKDATAESEAPKEDVDDIDAALRELALRKPAGGEHGDTRLTVDPEYERVCALLGINTQHLKVANEMRNLFGKAAVEVMEEPGGRAGRRPRQRGRNEQVDLETALKGHHQPGKGLSELTLRRNVFIQGKDDWPRATTGGLTMAVVDDKTDDGTVEFRYVHDKAYQTLQQTFQGFVEMGDPQNLIGLLTRNRMYILKLSLALLTLSSLSYIPPHSGQQNCQRPDRSRIISRSSRASTVQFWKSRHIPLSYQVIARKGSTGFRPTRESRTMAGGIPIYQVLADEGNLSNSLGMGKAYSQSGSRRRSILHATSDPPTRSQGSRVQLVTRCFRE